MWGVGRSRMQSTERRRRNEQNQSRTNERKSGKISFIIHVPHFSPSSQKQILATAEHKKIWGNVHVFFSRLIPFRFQFSSLQQFENRTTTTFGESWERVFSPKKWYLRRQRWRGETNEFCNLLLRNLLCFCRLLRPVLVSGGGWGVEQWNVKMFSNKKKRSKPKSERE